MSSVAIMFPGQGSEAAEMGLALAGREPDAMWLLQEASRVTGLDVPRALSRGARALTRTEILQPVLAAVGLAAARLLERRGVRPSVVTGHSLGELVAACFAARVKPQRTLALAAFRGKLMAEAARREPGQMVALRAEPAEVCQLLEDVGSTATIACHNAPGETVVSGNAAAIEVLLRSRRLSAKRLRVAGAWHSELMRSAVEPFRERLEDTFHDRKPAFPFRSAVARGELEVARLPSVLSDSIAVSLDFVRLLHDLEARGTRHIVVVAPSRTVRSLVRRTLRTRLELHGADDLAGIERLAERLQH